MKTFRLSFFLFASLITTVVSYGQEFYATGSPSPFQKVTISGTGCTSVPLPICPNLAPSSIALYRDTLYSTDGGRGLIRSIIANGTVTSCTTIGQLLQSVNALTADSTGMLYAASGFALYKINPRTGSSVILGNMPYSSAGDLLFYKGKLYMAALSPIKGIVKVNIDTPSLSTMYLPIPQSSIYGLVNVAIGCNENRIYAMGIVGNATDIIELNMDLATVVGIICRLPYGVGDAASSTETGLFAGINIQNIKVMPACTNMSSAASIQVNVSPGVNPYTFLFNNAVSNNTGLFTGLTAGNYPIHISSAGGCMLDTVVTVPVADTPNLQIQVNNAYCGNNNGSIISMASGTRPPYTYSLNNGTAQASGTFGNIGQGGFFLQTTDSNQCVSSANVAINMIYPQIVPVIATNPSFCNQENASITVTAPNAMGYSLNNGPRQASGQFNNLIAGTYVVSVFTTQGCRKDTTLSINTIYPPLVQTITINAAACNQPNGTITVTAPTATGFSLNNGTQQPVGQFTNLATGNYLVSIFTAQGCQKDTVIYISNTINPKPTVSVTSTTPDCYDRNNGSISLSVNGAYSPYIISLDGGAFNNRFLFNSLASGTFQVRIKDSDGCITDTVAIVPAYVFSKPAFTVSKERPTCLNPQTGSIRFTVTGSVPPYSIFYQNNSYQSDYVFTNLPAGNHFFKINDRKNCTLDSATISLDLIQLKECDTVYVPTGFTPDGNGRNDLFKAKAYGTLQGFSMSVYNRFGQPVFRSDEISKAWDGKKNGVYQPGGAYVWMISYRFEGKPERRQKGTVMLIR